VSDLPLLEPGFEDPRFEDSRFENEEQASPPRSRRRRGLIIISSVGVLLIVAVAVFGVLDWRRLHTTRTLSAPATIGSLRHDTDADATQTADYLREALGADIALSSTLGAVYSDPADQDRLVLLFGGTGELSSPDQQLARALALLNDSTGSVTGLHDVSPGPLGGTMRCGTSNGDGGSMSVCGWADRGSIAVALFPGRSVDESAELMGRLRAAVEHQN
jgi:hypothetical protein